MMGWQIRRTGLFCPRLVNAQTLVGSGFCLPAKRSGSQSGGTAFRGEWGTDQDAFAGNLIKHPCFEEMRKKKLGYRVAGELKYTDIVMEKAFWIGVYPGMTEERIEYIIGRLL